jgi:hypothetical protein
MIERATDGRMCNPAVTPKPKREELGFFDRLILAYWILCGVYGLWAWIGPCAGDWGCAEQELTTAIAAGFWLVVGLIVMSVPRRAASGRRAAR